MELQRFGSRGVFCKQVMNTQIMWLGGNDITDFDDKISLARKLT